MKRLTLAIAILSIAGWTLASEPAPSVLQAESQRIEAMHKAKDCVLAVFPANGQGGGSGVVISPDGYALSNFHVVLPCGQWMQCGMADGRVYNAVIVGIDPTGDIALIKLLGRNDFPCATLGDSDQLRAGDWVFAMGNPFLLATDFQPTATYGIVSGVHRYQFPSNTLLEYTDCIQIDASINPGNSGGPLFDAQGRLVGINGRASFEKRGRVNVGAAYAISINQIKNFLGVLRSGRVVDHATLGARVAADFEGRVVVSEILDTSDAYRRGLRYDDEIIRFGDRAIATPNGLKNVLGIFPKGWRVPLSYRRDGQRHDIFVRLAGVHGQEELLAEAVGRGSKPESLPIPKPNDEPAPQSKKSDKLPENPHKQVPLRQAKHSHDEILMPVAVQKIFAEKRGYANYDFNTRERQRVWNAWNARTQQSGSHSAWTFSGHSKQGDAFHIELSDTGATLKLPNAETKWTAGGDIRESLVPAHSGGLLPALYLWRRLATEGLQHFGELHYEGTSPLPGHERLVDVLVGLHKGVECRFYFEPSDGRLLALEMFADEDADPCEIYFSEDREVAGRYWPGRMEIRYGDESFAILAIQEIAVVK
jgi:S1-C subfamily serine protease